MGRMYEQWPETKDLINNIDVLVDGKFEMEKRNLNLQFRGSENQRLIRRLLL